MSAAILIDELAQRQPDLIRLAESVSFAVVIDRPLLRAARAAIPRTDASLEADLWFSRLARTRSTEGLTLVPEAAGILRQRLASNDKRLEEAWTRTQQMHAHLPETLKLEEKIAYLSVSKSPDATAEIEKLLQSVLAAMVDGGRDALANWIARAFTNFPTSVRSLDAARLLDAGARMRLGAEVPKSEADLSLVAPSTLPRTTVGVRLTTQGVEVDASATPAGEPLPLPQTRPLLLGVSWTAADGSPQARQITLQPDERTLVETEAEEVELRAINGERYQLRRSGSTPASVASYVLSFDEVLARHTDFVGRRNELERIRSLIAGPTGGAGNVIVVTGVAGSGKTALLAELVRQLRNEVVCIAHFFQPGMPRYSYFRAAEQSLIAQLIAHFDLPRWTISMRLVDALKQFSDEIEDRVVIVLDDIDRVSLSDTPEEVLEELQELPSQFAVIASSGKSIRPSSGRTSIALSAPTTREAEDYLRRKKSEIPPIDTAHFGELELLDRSRRLLGEVYATPEERFDLELEAFGQEEYARFLYALAVARAPLPVADAVRLARQLSFEWSGDTPSLTTRMNFGEESVAFVSDYAQVTALQFLKKENEARAHHDLAGAIALAGEDLSWYGLLHGPWHWMRAGTPSPELALNHRLVRRSVAKFGAEVALDFIDEVLRKDHVGLTQALREEAAALERSPEDTAAILYSVLRRAKLDEEETIELVHINPQIVSLRLRGAPPDPAVPDHLPASITAMHHVGPERFLLQLDAHELAIATSVDFWRTHPQPSFVLAAHTAPVTASTVFATDAVSGARDGSICFWELGSGRLLAQHIGHFDAVTAVVMGANYTVSCGADGTYAQWRLVESDTEGPQWRLDARMRAPDAITAAAGIPHSSSVVIGCRDGSVGILDGEWKSLGRFHNGPVRAMAVQMHLLATAGQDRMLRLYGLRTEQLLDAVPSDHDLGISGMSFSADAQHLVTWSADHTARIWSTMDRLEQVAVIRHHSPITSAAWTVQDEEWSGGESVASVSRPVLITASADGEIRLFDLDTRKARWSSAGHARAVRSILVADNAVHSAGDDRLIERRDPETGANMTIGAQVKQCGYLEETGTVVYVAGRRVRQRSLRSLDSTRWDIDPAPARLTAMTSRAVFISREEPGRASVLMIGDDATHAIVNTDAELTTIAVAPSGKVGMGFSNGSLDLPFASHWHPAAITAIALHEGSALSGAVDGAVLYTKPPEGGPEEFTTETIAEHPIRVTSVALNDDDNFGVSGALDGSLFIVDLVQERATRAEAHAAAVVQCAITNTRILTASDDGTLVIRDLSGKRLFTCEHRDRVTAFAFDRERDLIYTASLDRTLRAWTFRGEPRGTFYGPVGFTAVAAAPFGVLAGDDAGNIWLLDDLLRVPPAPQAGVPPKAPSKKSQRAKGRPTVRKKK